MNKLESETMRLRIERRNKCFSVVNRGTLWYNKLTKEQLKELEEWYQKWLDVTVTMQEPKTPNWID